jgi:hypothetical protein
VFKALGHDFRFWYPGAKSAFDAFGEFEPDIYIGTTYELDRAVIKNIVSRPTMKVALYASAWGDKVKDIDTARYPLVLTTEQEKRNIEDLMKATGKPDFVFIHATGQWLDGTMNGWNQLGVPYIGLLNAADTFVYLDGQKKPELECDVAFVGGYWGYKARNLDGCILPLCHPSSGLSVKIFGNQPWPVHQYLGGIDDSEVANLFASAKVCPNVSEPHSTELGWDIVERPFKVLASGGYCISDRVLEMDEVFPEGTLRQAFNHSQFVELVHNAIKHPEDSLPFVQKGRKHVLNNHTYFDRVAKMLHHLGFAEESLRTISLKQEILKGKL